jgi:hypothetical protein
VGTFSWPPAGTTTWPLTPARLEEIYTFFEGARKSDGCRPTGRHGPGWLQFAAGGDERAT